MLVELLFFLCFFFLSKVSFYLAEITTANRLTDFARPTAFYFFATGSIAVV